MEEMSKIIKNLFREKMNIVILLLVLILTFNIFQFVYDFENYIKIRKKIDYRYFNLTRSLEEINNVKIDTYKGELKYSNH